MFKQIISFTSIIFIHELGHYLAAKYYKWNIDKIYFYPYGGYTKFNDNLNRPIYQELIIMIMGPLFQIIYYFIIINFLSSKTVEIFSTYHYSILFFNLLPIYPLDGGKLLNLIFNLCLPFSKSFHLIISISFGMIFLGGALLLLNRANISLSFLMVILILVCKLTEENKKRNFYFNKFLLERYLTHYSFSKVKVIKKINDMYRDCKHVFFMNKKNYSEKEILKKYFSSRN